MMVISYVIVMFKPQCHIASIMKDVILGCIKFESLMAWGKMYSLPTIACLAYEATQAT